jgi:hypothetical protein
MPMLHPESTHKHSMGAHTLRARTRLPQPTNPRTCQPHRQRCTPPPLKPIITFGRKKAGEDRHDDRDTRTHPGIPHTSRYVRYSKGSGVLAGFPYPGGG